MIVLLAVSLSVNLIATMVLLSVPAAVIAYLTWAFWRDLDWLGVAVLWGLLAWAAALFWASTVIVP